MSRQWLSSGRSASGLSGHMIWHLLSALALLFVWRFYGQFFDAQDHIRENAMNAATGGGDAGLSG